MRLPQTIGPWRLLSLLGKGSFGSVYLGQIAGDLGFRQVVAVKLVDPNLMTLQPELATALIDEAHLLAKLHHPNIVGVRQLHRVSHEVLGDTIGMEMEYVEGQTITALMADAVEGPLPVAAVLSVLSGILDGLAYAHGLTDEAHARLGLVHRDLKPDNLMVDLQGQLRVLDFGIAWVRQRRTQETGTGLTKGTLAYMSPEQVQGQPLTARSDLYSVGVIAFEALAGEPYVAGLAWTPSARVQLMQQLVATRFEHRRERLLTVLMAPEIHGLEPEEARRIEVFLKGLLAAEPDARTPSAAEALTNLEALYDRWRPEEGKRELARRVGRSAPTRPLSKELLAEPSLLMPPGSLDRDPDETDDTDGGIDTEPGARVPEPPAEAEAEPAAPRPRRRRRRPKKKDKTVPLLIALLAMSSLVVSLLVVWSLNRKGTIAASAPSPAAHTAAVEVSESPGGTATVTFKDERGAVLLAPVLPGTPGPDALDLLRGDDGRPTFALVGTQPSDTETGVLALFDLRDREPRESWRVADFFAESPEVPLGAHRATAYGFDGVAMIPQASGVPHAVGLARDRFFAPSWMVRIDESGAEVGRRYHPGHLRRVLTLSDGTVAAAGVNNRLCPGGTAPCEQTTVLWVTPPPRQGEVSEFPPGCGGGEVLRHRIGYAWEASEFVAMGLHPSDEGMTLRLKPPGEAGCPVRLTFGSSGEYEGQYSDCGIEAPVAMIELHPEICAQWAAAAD